METNGRLNLLHYEGGTPLFLKDKIIPQSNKNTAQSIQNILQNTQLSVLFFSVKNIECIEDAIKMGVYEMSRRTHIIDTQDRDQLYIIMRATFLQYGLHQPENITRQIEVLNSRIVAYCVPKIYNEIQTYLRYKRDISTLVVPMDNPAYYHKDNSLEFKHFF